VSHTPGPWSVPPVHHTAYGCLQVWANDERSTVICDVSGAPSNPSALADARLIAAAPELMEAVTLLMEAMRMQEERESGAFHIKQEVALCIWNDALEAARAAIKKARGE
jgi:hypothetical protein